MKTMLFIFRTMGQKRETQNPGKARFLVKEKHTVLEDSF
jgi:hypothetical protein